MNSSTHSSSNKLSINLITLGCSKNLVDSEHLMAQLKTGGFQLYHDSDKQTDFVIINTCGFIHDAKQESIDTILDYVKLKEAGKLISLVVMGCLSERYKEDLKREIPEVDAFFGVNDFQEILKFFKTSFHAELRPARLNTTNHYAYLKIAEGCNRTCSFCAIPMIRGMHISRNIPSLISESKELVDNGTKELLLISQDLNFYGLDLGNKQLLVDLIRKLIRIHGLDWIRLHYLYPNNLPEDILDIMAEEDKVCNYLDIPFQHVSDNILEKMKRNFTKRQTYELIDRIRTKVPGIALRTSLMVGFPGETEKDFQELVDFVKAARFERMGVFTYSHEEDTSAFVLKDDIPEEVKIRRMEELMGVQQQISTGFNNSLVGKTLKVIIDRKEGDFYIGRTEYDSPEVDNEVLIENTAPLNIGEFYDIRIGSAEEFDLFGTAKI